MGTLKLAAGLPVFLLLSGCAAEATAEVVDVTTEAAAPSPTAPSSSEPTPGPTVDLVITRAVIFGTHIEWRNSAGDVIDSIGYADPTAFVSKVTEHFGAVAEEEVRDDPVCSAFQFDGLAVVHQPGWPMELLVTGSELNGVRIETPGGLSIGEDARGLIDATDPELKRDFGYGSPYWTVIYDPVGIWGEGGAEPVRYGARAMIENGALLSIMVPGSLRSMMHTSC